MAITKKLPPIMTLLVISLTLLTGCGGSASPTPPTPPVPPAPPAPLTASNVNLIFVVSEDLAFQASGDVNPKTANLTSQGLQRSLLMATFLKNQVLGSKNVTSIYALEPMTHLQTANQYPDMVAPESIQQFALLNQITLSSDLEGGSPYTGQNYPINASYSSEPMPSDVPAPSQFCTNCRGLDFNDHNGDNETLVGHIVTAGLPGFYVFSAPWETVSALLSNINKREGYGLTLPASYAGPNYVYAISITPSGSASLVTYDSKLNPPSTYPVLPPPKLASAACTAQTKFNITLTGGQDGAIVPAGANTNETLYIIRHAEAHPKAYWSDNNYVGAGQWRALDLPNVLLGKIRRPDQVYSMDPSQFSPGSVSAKGDSTWSTLAPALTAEPYAIANNVPYHLVTNFLMTDSTVDTLTSKFFFNGGTFSNQTVLVAWAYQYIQPAINALLATYHGAGPTPPAWPPTDYDTIWTVKLDAHGNLTVNNNLCEGIKSTALPAMPPQF
ncbi:MAG: hypothetical protein WA655_13660 [Candidatus Korobacteraceae bacterium]